MDWARAAFYTSAGFIVIGNSFLYGMYAYKHDLPPVPTLRQASMAVQEVISPSDGVLGTMPPRYEAPVETLLPDAVSPGLIAIAGDVSRRQTEVQVVDRDGQVIHTWRPVWSEIWPDDEGTFPIRPVSGVYLHGVAVMPDGSLVANFEHQSTFRISPCGDVLWKHDNLGHHSVHLADDGTIWAPAEKHDRTDVSRYPLHNPPLRSWVLQNISADGEILRTIPVIDVLFQNDLAGLLYMSSQANGNPEVFGDTLHLNDVETFPEGLESDIFEPGDILMSLRNINAIIVVDDETLDLKFLSVGRVMRHHDPDFIAGDRISVFDNRTFTRSEVAGPPHSRIVEIDALSGTARPIVDASNADEPFYTEIMGMHQRLDNGNILVVPAGEGRVLEFTPDGNLTWRYDNRVTPEHNMRVYMAHVLPEAMDVEFFERIAAECETNTKP